MLALFLAALESNEDKQVFIKIYEQHLPLMERTATRILKEQSDSEDAVQNAFVQIIRHFDKIHKIPREELPFWIISILHSEYLQTHFVKTEARVCNESKKLLHVF